MTQKKDNSIDKVDTNKPIKKSVKKPVKKIIKKQPKSKVPKRPTKLTPTLLKNLAFIAQKKSGNKSSICKALNISRETFYIWYRENEKFKKIYDDAVDSIIDFTESQLISNVQKGSQRAIEFTLVNRRPAKWQNMKTMKIQGDPENPLYTVPPMTQSELDEAEKRFNKQHKKDKK